MSKKSKRTIKKISKSKPTMEGAGVHLKRVFGNQDNNELDPFLLLDDFGSDNPEDYMAGFPWHPHRGIETITYMLHGEIEHEDSLGNKGVIKHGDLQWMTAGSGIIHQEMPKIIKDGDENSKSFKGFQLWANIPSHKKMMPPRYRDIKDEDIPEVIIDNDTKVRVICGEIRNVKGPVQDIITDPEYFDIKMSSNSNFEHKVKMGHTLFAYVIEGKGYFDDISKESTSKDSLVIFNDGDLVNVYTKENHVRFLLISGKPIKESVAWYGPIVMNTQEELEIAFQEYKNGTFLKHK